MVHATAFDPALLASWMATALGTKEQFTHTYYDNTAFAGVQSQFADNEQKYLRGRVVSHLQRQYQRKPVQPGRALQL